MPKSTSDLFDISDRVVVITGATGVLAGSAAKYLVSQGAKVVFIARDQAKLDKAIAETKGMPGECVGMPCNVLDRTGLEKVCDAVIARYGRVDTLINAAGGNQAGATIGPDSSILNLEYSAYRQVVELNLDGTVLPSLVFAKTLINQKNGSIINFSSMAATQAITRVVGYSAAKAAVDNFTKWLAVELAQKYGPGLRVNAIAPGFFIAEQNRRLLLNEDGTPTPRGKLVLAKTPFKRFGEANELHGALHFLVSKASAFVTGTVIPIDGGFSCFSGV
jgi:NAD(P)-dependent dehydrogenase (short-subunit alcohol dehydrogenase family)